MPGGFIAQGQYFHRSPGALLNWNAPPPCYPNCVTLPTGGIDQTVSDLGTLASQLHGKPGVRDSFNELELTARGFRCLPGAEWLYRGPQGAGSELPDGWCRIESGSDLWAWEASWKNIGSPTGHNMFPAALLSIPGIAFFGKNTGLGFDADCIADLSRDCVGLSNLFGAGQCERAEVFAEAAACAATLGSEKALVEYDSEEDLEIMQDTWFKPIGKQRVWEADAVEF